MSKPLHSDRYEQTYMDANRALARQRIPMAWWGHAIFAIVSALVVRAAFLHPRPGLFVGLAVLALLWLLFMTLRVAVTHTHVHVQLGFFGPKIPISRIEHAEAGRGPRLRTGWGIRLGFDGGVTYSVPAPIADFLQIVYRNESGSRQHIVRVMTDNPAPLLAAINEVRAAQSATLATRKRIDDSALELAADAQEESVPHDPQRKRL